MSYKKGDVLPLDASPECLKKTEVLRQIWTILSELGNQVTTFVIEPERNAGPMMLAIKCLKEGILKDEDLGKEEKATLATALRRAADWFVSRAKAHLRGSTSSAVTFQLARDELEVLFPQGTAVAPFRRSAKASIMYRHCKMLWNLLDLSAKTSVDLAQGNQDRFAETREGHIGPQSTAPTLSSAGTDTPCWPSTGFVLWGENLLSLAGSNWLDDNVVDAYLRLVCHHGNEHFELAQDVIFREGSPKWFAWPAVTFSDFLPTAMWPPNMYDEARPQDVKHHFLPWCHGSHWSLFHVYVERANWHVDFYSSIEGYNDEASEKARSQVVDTLKHFSGGILDLSAVHVQTPDPQPIQVNSYECGVLAINVARWLLEGWDLSTLRARDCPQYRQRMIVELEKWNLI
ncbi:MAG: hypothetical protein Q9204_008129 [Flavoplaca sp. TL-2023a]